MKYNVFKRILCDQIGNAFKNSKQATAHELKMLTDLHHSLKNTHHSLTKHAADVENIIENINNLFELYKILKLKNFITLNESRDLKEIFNLIFPEFQNLQRLERLKEICNHSQLNIILILATLLIDDNNSHEYFGHKYSISNNIKENLNLFAKNLNSIKENKDFFNKDLEKNINN